MLSAIDEYQTILLPIHDSFVCLDSFQEQLRSLMEEEYESVVGTDNTIAVEQKASSVAMTVEEKMMQDELGEGYTPFVEHPDEQRYAALQRQARHYQTEYGIVYEDVFTAQELEAKYIDLLSD